jgi:hypothetical protein
MPQAEVLALQTHYQTVQAAKSAAGKPGGAAGAGGKAVGAAAPATPAVPKQAAPAGKRKPGEPATTGANKGWLPLLVAPADVCALVCLHASLLLSAVLSGAGGVMKGCL